MKQVFIILALSLLLFSCSRKTLPSCVREKIDSIKSQPRWNPPAQIDEYDYNGQRVYLVTADCCDQYVVLMTGECSYICAPSGGITGKGDGKCSDFFEKAKHIRLVWKDTR